MLETVVAVVAFSATCILVHALIDKWGFCKTMPQEAMVQMSGTDEEMIAASKKIVRKFFGSDIYETVRCMKNTEKIDLMARFAKCLAEEYGLNTEIDVNVYSREYRGRFIHSENKAVFNISLLMTDKNSKSFENDVYKFMETIFHELRHAMQMKAIEEKSYGNFDEEIRNGWSNNLSGNYIDPTVDFRGYCEQPVEADAMTFAARIMEGVG